GEHGGSAEVAGFSGLYDVVERVEGFFDGGFWVPAVDLVEVDVVGAETAEALVQFKQNGFAGEAAAVGLAAHFAMDLGGDDDGFAAGVGLEKFADDAFAVAAGV